MTERELPECPKVVLRISTNTVANNRNTDMYSNQLRFNIAYAYIFTAFFFTNMLLLRIFIACGTLCLIIRSLIKYALQPQRLKSLSTQNNRNSLNRPITINYYVR